MLGRSSGRGRRALGPRPGELVPCDAVVLEGRSHVDTSRLTGEPLPVDGHGRDSTR